MKRFVPILLAVGLVVAIPIPAFANVGGGMTLDMTFHGSCDVDGYIEVDNTSANFVVFENQDHWSATQPIHHELGATSIADPGDRLVLRLFASDHATVLFKTDDFTHHGSEAAYFSDFIAGLDCSVVPYRLVMSDTAMPAVPSTAFLSLIAWLLALVGLLLGITRLRVNAGR
jgi:hypothetical protein